MRTSALLAALAACAALSSVAPPSAGAAVVLTEDDLDRISAGSAASVAAAAATGLGLRGTLALTTTRTLARERLLRRFTAGSSKALAAGDVLATTATFNQSNVAGAGTAAGVAVDVGSAAAGGTSRSSGSTGARGGPVSSVAYGTGVTVAVGGQTQPAAGAGSSASGNFLTINNQVVVPVNAGAVSVGVAMPYAVAVSLPPAVNALLGR